MRLGEGISGNGVTGGTNGLIVDCCSSTKINWFSTFSGTNTF